MLYRMIKRMIEKGKTDGLKQKINVFFTTDKLTKDEYNRLVELINTSK